MAIKKLVNGLTVNETSREKAMRAVLAELRLDGIKCQALLTSQLSVDDFVREVLRSNLRVVPKPHQAPSSSSSNGVDDFTQVCKSQSSQQSPPSVIATLMQPTAEVKKRPTDSLNSSILSSSAFQTGPTLKQAPKSELLVSHEPNGPPKAIIHQGSREEQVGQNKPREQEYSQKQMTGEASQQIKPSEVQNVEQTANEVVIAGDARSVSSDGPPPSESILKRFFSVLPSSLTHLNLERHVSRHESPASSPGSISPHSSLQSQAKWEGQVVVPKPTPPRG
jgi:hypothetical protein